MQRSTYRCVRRVAARAVTRAVRPLATAVDRVVTLNYEDLQPGASAAAQARVRDGIKDAYGPQGLGLLLVKGVPEFAALRSRLLPLGARFASLPEQTRLKYEHKASSYGVGWVHGKEMFKGVPDLLKGSYKSNPQYNAPTDDAQLIAKYPQYMQRNIWPTEELPELEEAFMQLGQLMVRVGTSVARGCDSYVASQLPPEVYKPTTLQDVLTESRTCKARLLNYFPQTESTMGREWCGWHNDHGALTALTSAMYTDERTGQQVGAPDNRAGLMVADRKGATPIKIAIPADQIAYQIGESAQVLTGGYLRATPHMVRGPAPSSSFAGIHRTTFAVFMQPNVNQELKLPSHPSVNAVDAVSAAEHVPPLASRWSSGQDFIGFTRATFAKYFERDGVADNA